MDHRVTPTSPAFIIWTDIVAAAVADASIPVVESDLELADCKWRRDGDTVLRLGLLLGRRRAHGEIAGRNDHHVRTVGAVLEFSDGTRHAPDFGIGPEPHLRRQGGKTGQCGGDHRGRLGLKLCKLSLEVGSDQRIGRVAALSMRSDRNDGGRDGRNGHANQDPLHMPYSFKYIAWQVSQAMPSAR